MSALLRTARALQSAAQSGTTQPLLRGKKFGLLCEADLPDAALFRDAATELGAHVSQIRPSLSSLNTRQEVQRTARLLGKLYDLVECQGLPSSLVAQVAADAGVPVYDAVASQDHPCARLADMLDGEMSATDKRRYVLQAVLLNSAD